MDKQPLTPRCSKSGNGAAQQPPILEWHSESEEAAPLFAPRIEDQCTQKQSHADANRDLHHPISYIKDRAGIYGAWPCRDGAVRGVEKALRAVVDHRYTDRIACDLLSRDEASHETARGCKTTGYLERKKSQCSDIAIRMWYKCEMWKRAGSYLR
jgi:hypothetical protein